MPTVKVEVYPEYRELYRQARHPFGKSRRGFKKWIKRRMQQALRSLINEGNK